MPQKNTFSIDVEDWFQVFYSEPLINRSQWGTLESKIEQMVDRTLMILSESKTRGTFFFVGWLAEYHPRLVQAVAEAGHEIGCHSYWHREVFRLESHEFKADLVRAKDCLEQASGKQVIGFRAPGYSIRMNDKRYLDTIRDVGFLYDSSLLEMENGIVQLLDSGLVEIPPNSLRIGGSFIPTNGGFFFRLSPFWLYRIYLRYLGFNQIPLNFYIHTWEVMTSYPRVRLPSLKYFIQYWNLKSVEKKLIELLSRVEFSTLEEVYRNFTGVSNGSCDRSKGHRLQSLGQL